MADTAGYMGYSMMVDHTDGYSYRFTMWPRWNGTALQPIWHDIRAVELYNHSASLSHATSLFDAFENVNIASMGMPFWQADPFASPLVVELAHKLKTSFGFSAGK